MIRGVSFKIPQTLASTVLLQILCCIDAARYNWFVIENQTEVWADSSGKEFFKQSEYSGNAFLTLLQSSHYIVFLKLQACFSDNNNDLHTYDEFLKDDCQIIILVNDSEFVELYCKDESISCAFYNNAVSERFSDVMYITEANDHRTKFNVL